jgi:beta-glucosidase
LAFPPDFLWGTATASHQIEGGCTNNNWARWEQGSHPDGRPHIARGQRAGRAADHWNRVPEDIRLMQDLGCNSYRFSVEWSKIEPREGQFDVKVLEHYSKEIDALIQAGIEPMLTLHHFSQPNWFDDKGGWERVENLDFFYRFAERVYEEYCDRVHYWCTFNEPTVFALVGWLQGSFPPGKRDAPLWDLIGDAVNVLCNMMLAHVTVYKQLKAIDARPQIGIVHNIFCTHPYRRWHPIDYIAASIADQLQNDLVLQFFKTGTLQFQFPILGKKFNLRVPEAPESMDFFGVNYYSHMFYKFAFNLSDPIQACAHPHDNLVGVSMIHFISLF